MSEEVDNMLSKSNLNMLLKGGHFLKFISFPAAASMITIMYVTYRKATFIRAIAFILWKAASIVA